MDGMTATLIHITHLKGNKMQSLGMVAYEAYFAQSGGKSLVSGTSLPSWDGLNEKIKQAWEAAAQAVAYRVGCSRSPKVEQ